MEKPQNIQSQPDQSAQFEKPAGQAVDERIDSRLAADLGVSFQISVPAPGQDYWKLIEATYVDQEPSSPAWIICVVRDENGELLAGVSVVLRLPGDQLIGLTDTSGQVEFSMASGAVYWPERGEHGPYSVYAESLPSDAVVGIGLPRGQSVQFQIVWQRACASLPVDLHLPAASNAEPVLEEPIPVLAPVATKPFSHYMLLGPGSDPATLTNLILSLDYIIRFTPLVGFSVEEAKNAEHVTIVANESAVSSESEKELSDAGCITHRISAPDSFALERMIQQLVASGSPYP